MKLTVHDAIGGEDCDVVSASEHRRTDTAMSDENQSATMMLSSLRERRHCRRTFREKLPAGTKLVARPGRWGNPYRVERVLSPDGLHMDWVVVIGNETIGRFGDQRDQAISRYAGSMRDRITADPEEMFTFLQPLIGKRLACYCPIGSPCHADVLVKLVEWADEGQQYGRALAKARRVVAELGPKTLRIYRSTGAVAAGSEDRP